MPRRAVARTASVPKNSKLSKYFPFGILLLVILVVVIALLASGDGSKPKPAPVNPRVQATACGPYRKDGVVTINNHLINVEIAYDSKAKEKGLAGRPCIEANWGMFFDLGHDGQYAFWMKGMNFPIDIIWINSAHNIATFEDNIQPSTYYSKNPYFENDPQHLARYVLEIKGGQSKQLGLDLGTAVHFQKT